MTEIPEQRVDQVRMSDKGLEAVPPGAVAGGKAGFADKKKVIILVALIAICGGVAAYQFLGGRGPKTAAGVSTAAPQQSIQSVNVAAVESVLARLEAGAKAETQEGLSVGRVEEIINTFDTYVRTRQVPLQRLRVNPFAVVQAAGQQEEQEQARAEEEMAAEERRRQMRETAAGLKVGSVMIAGQERTAIVGGKLCRVGDVIEGLRVEAIGPEQVTLSFEGETVDLRLKPETCGR